MPAFFYVYEVKNILQIINKSNSKEKGQYV